MSQCWNKILGTTKDNGVFADNDPYDGQEVTNPITSVTELTSDVLTTPTSSLLNTESALSKGDSILSDSDPKSSASTSGAQLQITKEEKEPETKSLKEKDPSTLGAVQKKSKEEIVGAILKSILESRGQKPAGNEEGARNS